MRAFLTAILSLGPWRRSALAPILGGTTGRDAAAEAPCLAAGQSQTARHFIAMAQAARRPREP